MCALEAENDSQEAKREMALQEQQRTRRDILDADLEEDSEEEIEKKAKPTQVSFQEIARKDRGRYKRLRPRVFVDFDSSGCLVVSIQVFLIS